MSRKQFDATAGYRRAAVCFAVVGVLGCLVNTAVADDDDIVNAAGFEAPFFSTTFLPLGPNPGQLEGQINPPGEGQVLPPGQWLRSPSAGGSTAVVQNAVAASGAQSVRVDKVADNDARWAVPVNALGYPDYPNPFPPETAQPCICVSWDMRVQQTFGPQDTFGPFFGVEAYDDDGNAVGLLGSLGVDATTGEVLYQATGTGFLTPTGDIVTFGDWDHYQIKLDYSTDQYSIFRNFQMMGTFGFVDPNLDQFSDADIATFAAAGDAASQALVGAAYFDNFLVREGACPIPEPGTLAMIALGLATLAAKRRASRR
jgi:hypothetical protein